MKIRILGGGFYGSHLAVSLHHEGHEVELHEIGSRLFNGASGANPARLHQGAHYPRSRLTRTHCQENFGEFMARYGHLTRPVSVNLYAVAQDESHVDFGNYVQTLTGEIDMIPVYDPREWGLANVEGAILTGERHIVIDKAREWFTAALRGIAQFEVPPGALDSPDYDLTIDCTFCALDHVNIDRFEPCLTVLLEGPANRAVTIMDGPFPSVYPWDEDRGLCSLTSAKYTPLAKCGTHEAAREVLATISKAEVQQRGAVMLQQIGLYWPEAKWLFRIADYRFGVRAMPLSGAAARLVDLVRVGERAVRVRAGKIDAVFHAEAIIKEMISKWSSVSPATAVKSSRKYPSTTASKSNGSHPA